MQVYFPNSMQKINFIRHALCWVIVTFFASGIMFDCYPADSQSQHTEGHKGLCFLWPWKVKIGSMQLCYSP